ncbi:zf-HC2 domain-containing protein [Intrasporangium flavum]|uniref:zf-HC2 domain-containing protein n=1 Tax=Intrasporangium flavum TaxID=1428657 RepID=UPI00096CD4BB|nr:sigma-70 family RNA polymerase sigma factor [Intrasporangium flavum]
MARPNEERRPGESDSALLDRARTGDDAAFETLWLRHVDAAREVAERVATPERAPDLVGDAFARTLVTIRAGGGPDNAFRPYLLATVRRLAAEAADGAADGTDDDAGGSEGAAGGELTLVGTDRDAAWAAWQALPGDERDLLWRLVVHEQSPAALAPVLGTTPDGVAAQAKRARDRLRRAYLVDLATATPDAACRSARRQFGPYGRDALADGDRDRVDAHLDTCARCREAVAGLVDVTELIRAGVGPHLLPGLFGVDEESAAEATPGEPAADEEEDADDEGAGLLAGVAAPGATLVATRADASGRNDTRRLDLPLVLVGGAAVVAVAGIAVLLALLGGSSPAPYGAAGRPTTSATRPGPGTEARPRPGVVVAFPTLPAAVSTAIHALSTSTIEAVSAAARVARPATTTAAARSRTPTPTRTPTRSPRPTPTAPPPGPVVTPGVPTVLAFDPSPDRRYTASIVAPAGWLITSVRDVRGGREVEHVGAPTQTFEGTLRAGRLVVEVTPQSGAAPGTLVTRFTDRTGALLPGSGGHPLP